MKILLGNKIDVEIRQIDNEKAVNFAKEKKMKYYEVSAKTGFKVKESIEDFCKEHNVESSIVTAYTNGGKGCTELAKKVMDLSNEKAGTGFSTIYSLEDSVEGKIEKIAKKVYGANRVVYTEEALKSLKDLMLFPSAENLPVCIAKTQYSLSDDKSLLGAPENFTVTVKDIKPYFGAGFITAYMGNIVTMPGLPKIPAAEVIDVDEDGNTIGIF